MNVASSAVLLVEDNPADVLILKSVLNELGLDTVRVARDGQESIDYLQGVGDFRDRDRYPLPKVVLLDLDLPLVPGLAVLKWIRTQPQFKDLVVLILTASNLDEDINLAYQLKANSFLVKSTSVEQLRRMARFIRDYWIRYAPLPAPRPQSPALAAVQLAV